MPGFVIPFRRGQAEDGSASVNLGTMAQDATPAACVSDPVCADTSPVRARFGVLVLAVTEQVDNMQVCWQY